MADQLEQIRNLIDSGDLSQARQLLKPLLKQNPSAEAWFLAARTMPTQEQAVACLRRALEIDALHSGANRMLYKLEGVKSIRELQREQAAVSRTDSEPLPPLRRNPRPDRVQRYRERQRMWNRVGCLFGFVGLTMLSLFALGAVGMLPGLFGTVQTLIGGPTPVHELDGLPLEQVVDAPLRLEPSHSEDASSRTTSILDHGYLHEYTFSARTGETYAIYVQFLSVGANNVSRNVVLLDPDGLDATRLCQRETILEGDNGVGLVCTTTKPGTWRVRVLGRQGESVGAYFIGVERLNF